ncbi:unnamed protein product [Thlaspi arvense]|uniref:Transmembrane protein n=1 Tax=Thlaspi arvense TaxID=13288 RepID=A0AAU9T774_THLAR|nr:unnamed protein product [Thlaspi arvense]
MNLQAGKIPIRLLAFISAATSSHDGKTAAGEGGLALRMSFCYPSSPKRVAMTVAFFASGAALFAIGMHLSYINVAPQQARTKARNDFVKERLRQKQGK